jgi:hypothetical protein
MVGVIQARGAGYAISRTEELETTLSAAMSSGMLLSALHPGCEDRKAWTKAIHMAVEIHTQSLDCNHVVLRFTLKYCYEQ